MEDKEVEKIQKNNYQNLKTKKTVSLIMKLQHQMKIMENKREKGKKQRN